MEKGLTLCSSFASVNYEIFFAKHGTLWDFSVVSYRKNQRKIIGKNQI